MTKKHCSLKRLVKEDLGSEDNSLGLYEILSEDEDVLYIGAGPIKSMISEHLEDGVFPMEDGRYYRKFTTCGDLDTSRRSLLEDHMLIRGKRPKYNK